jgi:dolichol-phosphate mannosyltransferase
MAATRRVLDGRTTLSIVIPCYDEAKVLPLLFRRLEEAAPGWHTDFEVVLVDDGSTDETWRLIRERNRLDPRWKGIQLSRNFGQQAALWAGLRRARGRVIAFLDADLQDPPELLDAFLRAWAEGFDVVYGIRRRRPEGFLKRLCYRGFYRLLDRLSEAPIPKDAGDFSLIDRRVARTMLRSREHRPFLRGLRARAGFRQLGIEYDRHGRAEGNAKYTLPKLLSLAHIGLTSCSTRPLHLAGSLGLIGLAGFLACLFPAVKVDATFLAVVFLGAIQLCCLGILGSYLARITENTSGQRPCVVRRTCGCAAGHQRIGDKRRRLRPRGSGHSPPRPMSS